MEQIDSKSNRGWEIAHRATQYAAAATTATIAIPILTVAAYFCFPLIRRFYPNECGALWVPYAIGGVTSVGTLSALHVTRTLKSDPDALKEGSISRHSCLALSGAFAIAWLGSNIWYYKDWLPQGERANKIAILAVSVTTGSMAIAGFAGCWHAARAISGETGPKTDTSWGRRVLQGLAGATCIAWIAYLSNVTRNEGGLAFLICGGMTLAVPVAGLAVWYAARND